MMPSQPQPMLVPNHTPRSRRTLLIPLVVVLLCAMGGSTIWTLHTEGTSLEREISRSAQLAKKLMAIHTKSR